MALEAAGVTTRCLFVPLFELVVDNGSGLMRRSADFSGASGAVVFSAFRISLGSSFLTASLLTD
jgi:hypothetical protein